MRKQGSRILGFEGSGEILKCKRLRGLVVCKRIEKIQARWATHQYKIWP